MTVPHSTASHWTLKPRRIFVEALVVLIPLVVGDFIWPRLHLPSYILWIFVAVFAVCVFGYIAVKGFRRNSSKVKS
jgi:hypothetical protein